MGGSIGLGNVTPGAEFNICSDPEAAARVFGVGCTVRMIGLDVTHDALMTKAGRRSTPRNGPHGHPGRRAVWEFYNRFHSQTYGFDGSPIHDAVALAHVFRPDLVQTEYRHVEIDCAPGALPRPDRIDLAPHGQRANAHVGVGIDGRAFIELLLSGSRARLELRQRPACLEEPRGTYSCRLPRRSHRGLVTAILLAIALAAGSGSTGAAKTRAEVATVQPPLVGTWRRLTTCSEP